MKKTTWLGVVFVVLVLGYIFYSSFGRPKYRVRVCIVFQGQRDCRTASAETREHAMSTAIANACALLAGGVTETRVCETTKPESVEWLQ